MMHWGICCVTDAVDAGDVVVADGVIVAEGVPVDEAVGSVAPDDTAAPDARAEKREEAATMARSFISGVEVSSLVLDKNRKALLEKLMSRN
jgi:hypothetical protein